MTPDHDDRPTSQVRESSPSSDMVERVAQVFHDLAWLHDDDAERYAKRVLEASNHAELVRLVQRFVARPSGNLVRDAKALLAKIGGDA